jgi:hypothetical protein
MDIELLRDMEILKEYGINIDYAMIENLRSE